MKIGKIQLRGNVKDVKKIKKIKEGNHFFEFTIIETFSKKARRGKNWIKRTQLHRVKVCGIKALALYKDIKKGKEIFISGILNIDPFNFNSGNRKTYIDLIDVENSVYAFS